MASSFLNLFHNFFTIFTWRDGIELICFSAAIYYCSLWLQQDRQKNLLGYFYSYVLILFFAYNLPLESLYHVLILFSPMLCMALMLIHQKTLQKNFVGLRNVIPSHDANQEWLELIMQTALININHNKELFFVLEHTDSLQDLLVTPLPLHAEIKKGFLDLLVESNSFKQSTMIWLNSRGVLLGLNTEWKIAKEFYLTETQSSWKEEAIFFTAKTDALIIKTNPTQRSFDLSISGKLFENTSADKALFLIKKSLGYSQAVLKGVPHATITHKERVQQPNA